MTALHAPASPKLTTRLRVRAPRLASRPSEMLTPNRESARRKTNDLCSRHKQIFGDMFHSVSWRFANLLTLSERISQQAPLGSLPQLIPRSAASRKDAGQWAAPLSACPAARSI